MGTPHSENGSQQSLNSSAVDSGSTGATSGDAAVEPPMSGTSSPIKAVFNKDLGARRLLNLRSNSDSTVFTMSNLKSRHHPTTSQQSWRMNEIADETETKNHGENHPIPSPLTPSGGKPEQTNGPLRPKFKKRISQFTPTSSDFSKFNFRNPWRKSKQKKEPINPQDYVKSAELIQELAAAIPAAVILGSQFQRDQNGHKRVPVLLELIQVDISYADTTEDHHHLGRPLHRRTQLNVHFVYGSGPAKLSWTVKKTHKDFSNLNRNIRAAAFQANPFAHENKKLKIPQLPKVYVPKPKGGGVMASMAASLRSRSSFSSLDETEDDAAATPATPNFAESENNANNLAGRRRSVAGIGLGNQKKRDRNPDYLKQMEEYMQAILRLFMFRADVNRLLNFLELSNMSIRLAPEKTFHGKEGLLHSQTRAKSEGWQVSHWKPKDISKMISRHRARWYMIRQSYIAVVDNITSTNLLEVFLVDSYFSVTQLTLLAGESRTIGASREGADENDDNSVLSGHQSHNENQAIQELADGEKESPRIGALNYVFQVENNERKLKLYDKDEKEIAQWCLSLREMMSQTKWSQKHRFDSFAPVRYNANAKWMVDGRDYFWTLSEAIDQAKDVIYIHDWWLSPELYLRRPAQGNQQWRLDRLLRRKAEEGVKIFVIIYRNIDKAIPIDSTYTKYSLLDLHPNIYTMRSPNPLIHGTVFWAHHEKICLIDHTIGFLGGLDLCYGRWDTPDHVLSDDAPKPFFNGQESDEELLQNTQMWPGKDYSNARNKDFFKLDSPYEDMYDRQKVPRMPWHDIHMMIVGQPVRDVSRHFIQRWNYLIRMKRPTRTTPLLLPPPDLSDEEARRMDLNGSCEIQILRSSGNWSLGLKHTECSIQNAYLKVIETSEHFIYIENQFFITSTIVDGTVIQNKIGDALVERIIRAHENSENWRAIIVIPLMPGFEADIDSASASSVRLIMMCQYLSISMGPDSIYGKLKAHGIDADNYIKFFSLRKWGKIGPNSKLVTEQLYIHAKCMIADDRVAIIGSANINERSQRGHRDSEIAAVIRDKHQVESTMGGEKYTVGVFAHTLRVRLMREHLGIDIDKLDSIDEIFAREYDKNKTAQVDSGGMSSQVSHNANPKSNEPESDDKVKKQSDTSQEFIPSEELELHSFNHFAGIDNIGFDENKNISTDSRIMGKEAHQLDVEGLGYDSWNQERNVGKRVDKLKAQKTAEEQKEVKEEEAAGKFGKRSNVTDIFKHVISLQLTHESPEEFKRYVYDIAAGINTKLQPTEGDEPPDVVTASGRWNPPPDPYGFKDPIDDSFYLDVWDRIARNNTYIFRKVFRCQPDDKVSTWKEYKEYTLFAQRFSDSQDHNPSPPDETAKGTAPFGDVDGAPERETTPDKTNNLSQRSTGLSETLSQGTTTANGTAKEGTPPTPQQQRRRKRANTMRSMEDEVHNDIYDPVTAESMLDEIQGHLVIFPSRWLTREVELGNWWFNFDRIPPLEIYD